MSHDINIFEPLANSIVALGKLSIKGLYKILNIEPLFDIEKYFKIVELKNKQDTYPTQIKMFKSTLGYTYVFNIPIGLNIEDFNNHKANIEAQVNKPIKIEFLYGYVHITIIEKELEKVINYVAPIRAKGEGIKIPIGESLEETIILDLQHECHTYIVGTTNSGKSVCSKGILTSLITMYKPYELELYLCDLKRVELHLLSNVKHVKKFVYTVEDTTQVIADLLHEVEERYNKCMSMGVTSATDYNKLVPHSKRMKYTILFVEEIVNLLQDNKKTAMKLLKRLISISRAVNCYVILTTQRPSNDILDAVVKANVGNKITFKVEDTKNSMIAIDSEGAELLEGQGNGIIKRGANKQIFRSYYITDEQVKELTKKYIVEPTTNDLKAPITPTKDKCIDNINKDNTKALGGHIETQTNKDLLEDLSFLDNL